MLHYPLSLRELDADGLEYVGKEGKISMSYVRRESTFSCEDELYKQAPRFLWSEGYQTRDYPRNLMDYNQHGEGTGFADKPSEQPDRAILAPCRSPPRDVVRNIFHASAGHGIQEILAASAKPKGVKLTDHLHPCGGMPSC